MIKSRLWLSVALEYAVNHILKKKKKESVSGFLQASLLSSQNNVQRALDQEPEPQLCPRLAGYRPSEV